MVHGQQLILNSINKMARTAPYLLRAVLRDYDIEEVRITAIYVVRNPDKLRQLY